MAMFSMPTLLPPGPNAAPRARHAAIPAMAKPRPAPSISWVSLGGILPPLRARTAALTRSSLHPDAGLDRGPGARVGDDGHVDPIGGPQDVGDDRLAERLPPARPVRLAEDDPGDAQLRRDRDHGLGDVALAPQDGRAEPAGEGGRPVDGGLLV